MEHVITAILSGKVTRLNINVGDRVEADEEVLIIEALKMETPVFAPCDGIVKEVLIKEGDDVKEDAVLAVIDGG